MHWLSTIYGRVKTHSMVFRQWYFGCIAIATVFVTQWYGFPHYEYLPHWTGPLFSFYLPILSTPLCYMSYTFVIVLFSFQGWCRRTQLYNLSESEEMWCSFNVPVIPKVWFAMWGQTTWARPGQLILRHDLPHGAKQYEPVDAEESKNSQPRHHP